MNLKRPWKRKINLLVFCRHRLELNLCIYSQCIEHVIFGGLIWMFCLYLKIKSGMWGEGEGTIRCESRWSTGVMGPQLPLCFLFPALSPLLLSTHLKARQIRKVWLKIPLCSRSCALPVNYWLMLYEVKFTMKWNLKMGRQWRFTRSIGEWWSDKQKLSIQGLSSRVLKNERWFRWRV